MDGRISNEFGNICIDKEVIAIITSQAAMECYGVVGMSTKNKVNGLVELLKLENQSKGVNVELNEDLISIEIFVILEYGTKISVVANNIIERVKYSVEKKVGLKVSKIDINVQGIRVSR